MERTGASLTVSFGFFRQRRADVPSINEMNLTKRDDLLIRKASLSALRKLTRC
jgi:hypothetical protein